MALDIKKINEQYPAIEIKVFENSHDHFINIDNTTVYHFGAVEMLTRLEGMK
jgi:hypothetical protein